MLGFLTGLVLVGASTIAAGRPDRGAELIDLDALRGLGLARYWEAQVPLGRGDSVKDSYLVDEALYVTTEGGVLFALEAHVGLIRWGEKLTEADYTIFRPTHIGNDTDTGPVAIPTTARFYVMDRFSGRSRRSFRTDFPPGSAAVGSGGSLFMGSADGHFYSIAWDTQCSMRPLKLWQVRANGPITATPVLYGREKLLFASQGGTVYSCFAGDKAFDWAYYTGGAILGDPVVDDTGVYIASIDRSLYKLDTATGEAIWRFRAPSPLPDGPTVTSHTVYQYCSDYGLIAIDAYTGREKWHMPKGRTFLAHTRDRAALLAENGYLHLVDHETGRSEGAISVPGVAHGISNVQDDAVYLLGRSGRVVCIRPEGAPYLRPGPVAAARARLNLPPRAQPDTAEPLINISVSVTDPLADDPLRSRRDLAGQ